MAREIRILHTADTHLGYTQYYSEVRRKDFFKAFEIVINDAIDMQVDAVVHAGDLFDSRNPTLEDILETISILFKLKACEIPFFGIVGNHESKQNKQWLDLFEKMELAIRLSKKPQILRGTAIYGIDSVPRSKIPLFDYSGFEAPDSSLPENCKKLLVMHQIIQPFHMLNGTVLKYLISFRSRLMRFSLEIITNMKKVRLEIHGSRIPAAQKGTAFLKKGLVLTTSSLFPMKGWRLAGAQFLLVNSFLLYQS